MGISSLGPRWSVAFLAVAAVLLLAAPAIGCLSGAATVRSAPHSVPILGAGEPAQWAVRSAIDSLQGTHPAPSAARGVVPSVVTIPWNNLTSSLSTAPSPRTGAGITYDAADGYV